MGFPVEDSKMLKEFYKSYIPAVESMRSMYKVCIERKNLIDRIKRLMDWDEDKAELWMATENLNFGGIIPDVLVVSGRIHVLETFIKEAEANKVKENAD
jgi:hypothetical protein